MAPLRGNSSAGRAQPCQGWGREFESRLPLNKRAATSGFLLLKCMLQLNVSARVVELVDTQDLKSCDRKIVWVQVPSRVHILAYSLRHNYH